MKEGVLNIDALAGLDAATRDWLRLKVPRALSSGDGCRLGPWSLVLVNRGSACCAALKPTTTSGVETSGFDVSPSCVFQLYYVGLRPVACCDVPPVVYLRVA